MARRLMISVFLALVASASVHSFEISSMSAQSVNVKEGEDVELWCKSDDYWEWCKITHVASDTRDPIQQKNFNFRLSLKMAIFLPDFCLRVGK